MKENYFKKRALLETISYDLLNVKNNLNNHLTGIFILLFGLFGMNVANAADYTTGSWVSVIPTNKCINVNTTYTFNATNPTGGVGGGAIARSYVAAGKTIFITFPAAVPITIKPCPTGLNLL